jgi:hypothetical protein
MAKGIDAEKVIKRILEQADEDRAKAKEFLDDVSKHITSSDMHAILGVHATNYLKAMNKSTDQMIRMAELALKYEEEKEETTIEGIREMLEGNAKAPTKGALASDESDDDGEDDE